MTDQVIDGLLPDGTYSIEASAYGQVAATGLATITVKGGPVSGPPMALAQNSSITVQVKEEFTSVGDVNSGGGFFIRNRPPERGPRRYLNVFLEPADDFARAPGASLRPPSSRDDESLTIENVRPGRYWVRVNSSRGYAASITSGGIDLQHQPLVVPAAGSIDPIEITMRDDWAQIDCTLEGAGTITPGQQNFTAGQQSKSMVGVTSVVGLGGAHVYLIPQPDSPGEFRDLWMPHGGEASMSLPPGLYRVLTFDDQQPELEYHDPEAMRAYESKGQLIRLGAGQKEHLRLQVIPASE